MSWIGETGGTGTGNFTPSKPSGIANDHLMLLSISFEKGTDVSIGGGISLWSLIERDDNSTNIGHALYGRIEDGTSLTEVTLSNGPKYTWSISARDGVDTADPYGPSDSTNGSSGNPNPPSVVPDEADQLAILACGNKKAPTGTAPSGYTERVDRANTGDGLTWTYEAEKQLSGTPSSEDPGSVSASETEAWVAITALINPSASETTYEGDFTADATTLETQSSSASLDAVIRGSVAGSFASDAIASETTPGSFPADALILSTESGGFTADGVIEATEAASLDVFAVLQREAAGSFSASAVLREVQSEVYTLDATIMADVGSQFLADAALKGTQTGGVTAAAVLISEGVDDFVLDAVFLHVESGSFAADAVAFGAGSGSYVLDAAILKTSQLALTADALAQAVVQGSTDLDAVIIGVGAGQFTGDAIARRIQEGTLLADAVIEASVAAQSTVDAIIIGEQAASQPLDAILLAGLTGSLTADAWISSATEGSFTADAVLSSTVAASLTADALVLSPEVFTLDAVISTWTVVSDLVWVRAWIANETFGTPLTLDAVTSLGLPVDAVLFAGQADSTTVDAFISDGSSGGFGLDAVIEGHEGSFGVDAAIWPVIVPGSQFPVRAVLAESQADSLTLDAEILLRGFGVDAIIGTVTHPAATFLAKAYLALPVSTVTFEGDDALGVDAYIDSAWSDHTFTIDAAYVGPTREGSFTLAADLAGGDEERATTALDAVVLWNVSGAFVLWAEVVEHAPVPLAAFIVPYFTLDAWVDDPVEASLTADAWLTATTIDAVVEATPAASTTLDAFITQGATYLDTVVLAEQVAIIEVLAKIVGGGVQTFTLDALLGPLLTLDAYVQPYFTVGAYLEGKKYVVYPASQEGYDGVAVGPDEMYALSGEFDSTLVGETIVIEGASYTIITVPDSGTVTVSPTDLSGSGLHWYIPSGDATDPVGDPPPITREFEVVISWSRPMAESFTAITDDVMWGRTKFTQMARVSPGTFELALLGSFSEFVGGEEIRVEIDGRRVFGGYVSDVERGYVFEDDADVPMVTLRGVDFNWLLDRPIYNAEWDEQQGGSGLYRAFGSFAQGTSDKVIIDTILSQYVAPLSGFDLTTYVDEIESPAPVGKWTMQTGTTLRQVFAEISRITEGVFWFDAYKNFHYHDRAVVSAPYPITDGDSGIACRGLKIKSSLGVVVNDVFAWGTQAYMDTGDSDIIYSRATATKEWDEEYWQGRVDRTDTKIDLLKAIPAGSRTVKQKTRLSALQRAKRVYQGRVERAQTDETEGSVERLGRWQYGEVRQDIYHQNYLDRRTRAIMKRYSEPVVKGEATVFDPGYQAGMVAEVVSVKHDTAEDLVIREMTIDFPVAKEPVSGKYFAVPRYSLSLGLDPEDPWDIYEFLPFPDPEPEPPLPPPPPEDPESVETVEEPLDTFIRPSTDVLNYNDKINTSGGTLGWASSGRIEKVYDYSDVEIGTRKEMRPWAARVLWDDFEGRYVTDGAPGAPTYLKGNRNLWPHRSIHNQFGPSHESEFLPNGTIYMGATGALTYYVAQWNDQFPMWEADDPDHNDKTAVTIGVEDGMLYFHHDGSRREGNPGSPHEYFGAQIGRYDWASEEWDYPWANGIFDMLLKFRVSALGDPSDVWPSTSNIPGLVVGPGTGPAVIVHLSHRYEPLTGVAVSDYVSFGDPSDWNTGLPGESGGHPTFVPVIIIPGEWHYLRYSRQALFSSPENWDNPSANYPEELDNDLSFPLIRAKLWNEADAEPNWQTGYWKGTHPESSYPEEAYDFDDFDDYMRIGGVLGRLDGTPQRVDVASISFATPNWTGGRGVLQR
jgi:hypothetical protein